MSKKTTDKKPPEQADVDEATIVRQTWEGFERAYDSHEQWVTRAERYENFFAGKQWENADLEVLRQTGRPALTINLIKPAVMTVVGEQQNTRAEINYKPRNSMADSETAKILNQTTQFVEDDTDYPAVESQVFFDGCVQDRGFFDIRIDTTRNLRGDIVIEADNPKLVLLGPDVKHYDPDKWPEIYETYWWSMDRIEKTYGKDVAKKVRTKAGADISYISSDRAIRWHKDRVAEEGSTQVPDAFDTDGNGRYIESMRVVERQYFVYTMAPCFVDVETGDVEDAPMNKAEDELKWLAARRGMQLTTMLRRRVRWVIVVHDVLVYNEWSDYPFLTKVMYSPTFLRGRPIGLVGDMVGPQEQLNKIESQELHVINTTANSGWVYEEGSVLNMDDDEFANSGAKTGLNIKVRKNAGFKPEKIQPNQIPSGLAHKASKNIEYLRFISMVNDAMLGFTSPEVSGVAMDAKKRSGITAFTPMFNNLALSRKYIARRILWLLQNYYTDERVIRITDYSKPERPDVEVPINAAVTDQDGNQGVLNNLAAGRYNVVVSSAPARDTFEDSQFAEVLQMRDIGINVPDDEVIRRSNLADKYALADRVAQMMGFGEPTEQELQIQEMMQQMEMQRMQLELQEMQARANELMTRAELNMAKAAELKMKAQGVGGEGTEAGDAMIQAAIERERMAHEARMNSEKIAAQMEQTRMTLEAKQQIAMIQVGAKREGMLHDSAVKRSQSMVQAMGEQRKEKLDAEKLKQQRELAEKQIKAKAKQPRGGKK
jgi:hypothetical protein